MRRTRSGVVPALSAITTLRIGAVPMDDVRSRRSREPSERRGMDRARIWPSPPPDGDAAHRVGGLGWMQNLETGPKWQTRPARHTYDRTSKNVERTIRVPQSSHFLLLYSHGRIKPPAHARPRRVRPHHCPHLAIRTARTYPQRRVFARRPSCLRHSFRAPSCAAGRSSTCRPA